MVRNALAPFKVASVLLLVAPAFRPDAAGFPGSTAPAAPPLTLRAQARTAVSDGERALRRVLRAAPGVEAARRVQAAAAARHAVPVGKAPSVPGGAGATAARGVPTRTTARAHPLTHVVQPGDTLWTIAYRYGTTVEALMNLNGLTDPDRLQPGQRLAVAGRVPRAVRGRRDGGIAAAAPAPHSGLRFAWPARGVITSRFGWRRYRYHHNGIDVAAPAGTPIYAASDGVVEFAGWKGGYGRVVYVRHPDGVTSVYAHASQLLVRAGQRVTRGQAIARVGCTGACTGPHLHFEVHVDGRPVNPITYLR